MYRFTKRFVVVEDNKEMIDYLKAKVVEYGFEYEVLKSSQTKLYVKKNVFSVMQVLKNVKAFKVVSKDTIPTFVVPRFKEVLDVFQRSSMEFGHRVVSIDKFSMFIFDNFVRFVDASVLLFKPPHGGFANRREVVNSYFGSVDIEDRTVHLVKDLFFAEAFFDSLIQVGAGFYNARLGYENYLLALEDIELKVLFETIKKIEKEKNNEEEEC